MKNNPLSKIKESRRVVKKNKSPIDLAKKERQKEQWPARRLPSDQPTMIAQDLPLYVSLDFSINANDTQTQ